LWPIKAKKSYPETDESGTFWISTVLDIDSRLRAARGIGKNETEASKKAFQMLQRRGHPDAPPPLISDGWGGIDDAMLEVYGIIPQYCGRGRPPTRPKPGKDWLYLQMVKHRDEHGKLQDVELKAIWGSKAELIELLGKSTAYIERSNLTARLFNARLTRTSSRCPSGKHWPFRKTFRHMKTPLLGKMLTTIGFAHTKDCVLKFRMILLANGYSALLRWLPD